MRDENSLKEQLINESQYSNETQRIYAAQVNRLYQHIPIGITGTLVNSIILVYILSVNILMRKGQKQWV